MNSDEDYVDHDDGSLIAIDDKRLTINKRRFKKIHDDS